MRFVAADNHPDHDTISPFRREKTKAFEAAFLEVLLMVKESGLLKLGTVSIDGTKIDGPEGHGQPPAAERQTNLTDPDSQLMRKSARHDYRQAYNAQAVVDADGTQLVVATHVATTPSDQSVFVETIAAIDPLVAISARQPHRPYDFRL